MDGLNGLGAFRPRPARSRPTLREPSSDYSKRLPFHSPKRFHTREDIEISPTDYVRPDTDLNYLSTVTEFRNAPAEEDLQLRFLDERALGDRLRRFLRQELKSRRG